MGTGVSVRYRARSGVSYEYEKARSVIATGRALVLVDRPRKCLRAGAGGGVAYGMDGVRWALKVIRRSVVNEVGKFAPGSFFIGGKQTHQSVLVPRIGMGKGKKPWRGASVTEYDESSNKHCHEHKSAKNSRDRDHLHNPYSVRRVRVSRSGSIAIACPECHYYAIYRYNCPLYTIL